MSEMIKDLIKLGQIIMVFTLFSCASVVIFIAGMKFMHIRLTDDMKRNQDTPIPAISKDGRFYLYQSEMSFEEWFRKAFTRS